MSSQLVKIERSRGLAKRSEPGGDSYPSPSAQNNMFGSIAGNSWPIANNSDFIPIDNSGGTMRMRGDNHSPRWLGLDTWLMQSWAYDYCSPLAAVIDRIAEADTNGRIEFLDENGATMKQQAVNKNPAKLRVQKLFTRPNPLQTWHEFNNEQVCIAKKHGFCVVFMIRPKGMDATLTKFMINISPLWITPIRNENFDLFSEDEANHNPIKEWRLNIYGQNYTIDAEDVLIIKDGLTSSTQGTYANLGLPKSKTQGLDYFISNICAAMEADNVLLKKKGPLGVFSYDAKPDMAGITAMDPDDEDDLQKALGRYGLTWNQLQYVISKAPIKWLPMSFNVEELKTKETIRMGIDGICDRFGYPAELMSGKNATYENRSSAEKFLYQNNIIPFSLRRMAQYEVYFGIKGIVLDYDHLPILQEDILHAGQARYSMSESLLIDWEAGMIDMAEYRNEQGMDFKPEHVGYFYKDYIRENPTLNKNAPKDKPAKKEKLKKITGGQAA